MWILVQAGLLVFKYTILQHLPWFVVLLPLEILVVYIILFFLAVGVVAIFTN